MKEVVQDRGGCLQRPGTVAADTMVHFGFGNNSTMCVLNVNEGKHFDFLNTDINRCFSCQIRKTDSVKHHIVLCKYTVICMNMS